MVYLFPYPLQHLEFIVAALIYKSSVDSDTARVLMATFIFDSQFALLVVFHRKGKAWLL